MVNSFKLKGGKLTRKLPLFQNFDFGAFQAGKRFVVQSVKYNEKRGCVTVTIVIIEDHTNYGDPSINNLYEKFSAHLINEKEESAVNKFKTGDEVIFKSIGRCTVWGDYSSQLSVEAEIAKK